MYSVIERLSDYVKPGQFDGKYIFWDIDGTLAAYRFNGHVSDPDGTDNGQSADEVESHIFRDRKPSLFMQRVLADINAKRHIVLGACWMETEVTDKHIWLDKYYPMIEHRILLDVTSDMSKADAILSYCRNESIGLEEVVFVDDVIRYLREAERKGIESWHISSFLDWFLEM